MKVKKPETQIAIIGATQSGKTTLAAGLAKTSDKHFTVGFNNKLTEEYLQPRIAGIAAGHWPEPTNEEDKDICLKLNTLGGRTALISFKEYKGERIQDENYLEQIVGKPNGALILLNPGMDLLQDPEQCEKLIGYLKGIVDHLKVNKCVAVAFVVTACDRLKTDLKDFAEKFENCAAEVTNYLNTSGMNWKRFDVTITGELDDQKKPTIAEGTNNTSREPFLWIMDRVAGRKRMTVTKRIVNLSGCCLLAGLMAFGVFRLAQWHSEKSEVAACEAAVAQIENRINSATVKRSEDDLNCATDDLAALITSNQTFVCRFKGQQQRLETDMQSWSNLYDKARSQYLSVSMDRREEKPADRGSEEACQDFDKLLAAFSPSNVNTKIALTNRWAELRLRIREGYDVECGNEFGRRLAGLKQKEKNKGLLDSVLNFKDEVSKWTTDFVSSQNDRTNVLHGAELLRQSIEDELDLRVGNDLQNQVDDMAKNAATKATVDALEKLRQNVARWEPYTDKGKARKSEISKNFEDKRSRWEQSYLDNCCTTNAEAIVRKIQGLNPNDSSLRSDDICDTLKTAYGFTNQWGKASADVLSAATNMIYEAKASFLAGFQNSFAEKWDVNGRKPPEVTDRDKEFIRAALDIESQGAAGDKLSVAFLNGLESERKSAEEKWLVVRKKVCVDFLQGISGNSVLDLFDKYRSWYEQNSDNPAVTSVDQEVEKNVEAFFEQYIEEMRTTFLKDGSAFSSEAGRKRAADRFVEFQRLCLALAKDGCGIKDSWSVKFARNCVNSGKVKDGMNKAFEQRIKVSRIDVKVVEDAPYNDYIGGKFSVSYLNDEISSNHALELTQAERFLAIDGFNDYVVKTRDSWQTLWKGSKLLSLNPWSVAWFRFDASLDLSGTAEDAKSGDNSFCRILPLRSEFTGGEVKRAFKCTYLTWGGKTQSYSCHVRIHCTFEGADIFDLFNQYRK